MRAGLLSDPGVIRLLKDSFVTTWVLIDELHQHPEKQPRLAKTLLSNWEYPLDLMFLTSQGEFASKLNSFRDLPQAHADVGHHSNPFARRGPSHTAVFLQHSQQFLRAR